MAFHYRSIVSFTSASIAALRIATVLQGLFQLAFCQCFHCGGGLLVQRTAAKILRDRVKPLCIDFLDRMVGGKLPLLPSTKIPDLTAGAPAFVSGSQTVTVLGISCVGSQEPFSADGAFSRRVSDS